MEFRCACWSTSLRIPALNRAAGRRIQEIGYANSIMDYIFRWLDLRFLTGEQQSLFDDLRPRSRAGGTAGSGFHRSGERTAFAV